MADKELSQKVYRWAHSRLGHKVDSGECWDLVNRALQHAGAQSSTTTGPDDDYVWGTVLALGEVVPGDVLQLRNFVVTTTITTTVTFEDGSGSVDTAESSVKRIHHTAIVAENRGVQGLVVFEQNVDPGGKKVQRNTLLLAGSGPVIKTEMRTVKDDRGKLRNAKVVLTTTTRVSGRIWAYRPRAKQ